MLLVKKSEATAARRRIPVALVDDTDGKTPETGVTFSAGDIKVSKNGGAEANHAGTVTELATGDYFYEATQAELDTVGFVTFKFVKAGVRTFRAARQVVDFDPYDPIRLGMTSLPGVAVEAIGGIITRGTGTGQLNVNTGRADSDVKAVDGSTTAATIAKDFWTGAIANAGTAQESTATSITLAVAASSINNFYNGSAIAIVSGAGAGQTRKITAYTGATRIAILDVAWVTNPDNTSKYHVLGRIV